MTKSRKSPARRSNSGGGNAGNGPGKGHNSAPRKKIIRDACSEITSLAAQRRAIGEQIRTIKTVKIKGALGLKIGDFNVALRLYQLEGADRDQLLDTVRETFEALGVGEQLNWLDAAERAAGAATEHVDEGAEAAAAARSPVGSA